MASLGLDENGYHVVIEYKCVVNENVINQGLLYYLRNLEDIDNTCVQYVAEETGDSDDCEEC